MCLLNSLADDKSTDYMYLILIAIIHETSLHLRWPAWNPNHPVPMSLHRISYVGSTPHERPESVWEVMVEAEFNPALSEDELAALQEAAWERLGRAIHEVLAPFVMGNPGTHVSDVRGRGEETPLFPMIAGDTRFNSSLDMVEAVEVACQRTDLAHIAYDARGRAYELGVEIAYQRRPELDGVRRAALADAAAVEEVTRRRAEESRRMARSLP